MCGGVRYTVEGDPLSKALCHCRDCQKTTGSTYSTNGIYPAKGFTITQGQAKAYASKGSSGNTITSYFCPDCGSTMWRDGGAFPGLIVLKLGTLDDTNTLAELKPVNELYVPRRVPWVPAIEGAQQKDAM